jgi:hypothetical protein
MLIARGAPSFVTRSNWIVVDDVGRPRTVAFTGRSPLLRVEKIRNDLVMSTEEIVTVWIPVGGVDDRPWLHLLHDRGARISRKRTEEREEHPAREKPGQSIEASASTRAVAADSDDFAENLRRLHGRVAGRRRIAAEHQLAITIRVDAHVDYSVREDPIAITVEGNAARRQRPAMSGLDGDDVAVADERTHAAAAGAKPYRVTVGKQGAANLHEFARNFRSTHRPPGARNVSPRTGLAEERQQPCRIRDGPCSEKRGHFCSSRAARLAEA